MVTMFCFLTGDDDDNKNINNNNNNNNNNSYGKCCFSEPREVTETLLRRTSQL